MTFAEFHSEFTTVLRATLNCHVDYWQGQTESLENENPFPRPAVFVEYPTVDFAGTKGPCGYSFYLPLRLHLVSDLYKVTTKQSGITTLFKLLDEVIALLNKRESEAFTKAKLLSVEFDRNPSNLIKHIVTIQVFINF